MLVEPVAVAVGLERWSAVRAWLSNTRVPLASLQLTAADGRAAQQVNPEPSQRRKTELMALE